MACAHPQTPESTFQVGRYLRCRPCRQEWRTARQEKHRQESLVHYRRCRAIVEEHYGPCRCGSTTDLEIHHVDGDGSAHRAEIKRRNIATWLVARGLPAGFVALCSGCHRKEHSDL